VDTPASSTTKTGSHDIAEILLKVALKQQKNKKKINQPIVIIHEISYDRRRCCSICG
jgi:hypothetical protein